MGNDCNAVINCILGPHYPGNSGDLAGTYLGIYRILCPRRPGTYPGLMQGDISVKRAGNILPRDVHTCQDSDQRRPGLWDRDILRDLQEKFPLQSRQYTGLYIKHHKVQTAPCAAWRTDIWIAKSLPELSSGETKIESPGKSLLSPGSGGPGLQLIAT